MKNIETIDSFLDRLQGEVDRYLNANYVFKDIPVISHRQSDFESCVDEFAQTGVGLCIVVLNPIPNRIVPGDAGVAFEDIQIRVQVIESACTNATGLTALMVAEEISRCLHHFQPELNDWFGWLSIQEKQPWKETKDTEKLGRYMLEVNFQAKGSIIQLKEAKS